MRTFAALIIIGLYSITLVVQLLGIGIAMNTLIGLNMTFAIVLVGVEPPRGHMKGIEADCVFLSCTNWRAIEAIEPLEQDLGLPVISSNQVTLESTRLVGNEAVLSP